MEDYSHFSITYKEIIRQLFITVTMFSKDQKLNTIPYLHETLIKVNN